MIKLVGYIPMKKKKGKVLFIEQDGSDSVVGKVTDKIFLFDDLSDKIKPEHIGHELTVSYGMGYSGKAYVSDVSIK
ncbi:hypothetical protein [Roseburia sp. AF20-18LB]|uniref:hypothetical protein n=1 Tax=Roseburia sp. AF20-18LB TaxID=2293129 RepID=UPI000E549CE0|nr:hypothetical protein [Roseburia sp. AF20-18LB]RGG51189.1 hypothetical protein DWX65_00835 [Roseburia sp. AF20-18LB]